MLSKWRSLLARWAHRKTGGAITMLDLDKAYDRAQPEFLLQVLHAMKFPDCFIAIIARLYEDCWARMKVNGHIGDAFRQKNGLSVISLMTSMRYAFRMDAVCPSVRHLMGPRYK